MESIGNISPAPAAHTQNNPPPRRQLTANQCVNALSAHLGSQLTVQGMKVFGDMDTAANPLSLTHLMFYEEGGRAAVVIHLIRNHNHLMLTDVLLPSESDPLDMLFRAVATSINATLNWNEDTPPAKDAQTQALRRHIESEIDLDAETPDRAPFTDSPNDTEACDSKAHAPVAEERRRRPSVERKIQEIESALAGMERDWERMSMSADRLTHAASPAAPGSETQPEKEPTASPPPYNLRRTSKRPNLSELAPPSPAKTRAAPATGQSAKPVEDAHASGQQP